MLTIRALARELVIPAETCRRQIINLHRQCQAGTCGAARVAEPEHKIWLFRPSRGQWCVNLSRLRVEHPERYPGPNLVEVTTRLVAAEAELKQARKRSNALAAAFREHAREHREKHGGGDHGKP
jgi:hypothetical protein